tara:strand:+ start:24 stop:209 length:186 start_codon:yes stop_codon:yes gene_type:complete
MEESINTGTEVAYEDIKIGETFIRDGKRWEKTKDGDVEIGEANVIIPDHGKILLENTLLNG